MEENQDLIQLKIKKEKQNKKKKRKRKEKNNKDYFKNNNIMNLDLELFILDMYLILQLI
jgi:hypothetical protein